MSLVTPEFGLLFWMVVIFGIVFFLLAKFGFPIITSSVEKRSEKIAKSLKDADEIEARMASWKVEQARMMEDVRRQQSAILKEAAETRSRIVADAKVQAKAEADKMIADAKLQIAAEKESALRDVRKTEWENWNAWRPCPSTGTRPSSKTSPPARKCCSPASRS